jgi:hypothetical protein
MFVPSNALPGDSRIWIYQSDRQLTSQEEEKISKLAREFLETWTAHQKDLKAGFEIHHHLFLIIMLDQNHESASGCSIDKSMQFIQQLEKDFSLSLLNRQMFAIVENDEIKILKRKQFDEMIKSHELDRHTLVFNNLIERKSQLDKNWKIPAGESWHSALLS